MNDLKTVILDAMTDGYTMPTLDTVDRESGDRIRTYLFHSDGLYEYTQNIGKTERTALAGMILDMIYREIQRASESHDPKLVEWHMIRHGCLNELLHELQRKRGADSSEPLVKFTE